MHHQVNHPVSLTSIEAGHDKLVYQENVTSRNNPTVEPSVRINKNPTSDPPSITQAVSPTNQKPGSILWNAPAAPPAETSTPSTIKLPQSDEPARKTIIGRHRKLLIGIDKNGHEKMFHVEDFVGLYPAWPIIELPISPLGDTKNNMMNHFVKCCASLFAKIL
jgi:hypothetical protein